LLDKQRPKTDRQKAQFFRPSSTKPSFFALFKAMKYKLFGVTDLSKTAIPLIDTPLLKAQEEPVPVAVTFKMALPEALGVAVPVVVQPVWTYLL
jgi:hypothetical protein